MIRVMCGALPAPAEKKTVVDALIRKAFIASGAAPEEAERVTKTALGQPVHPDYFLSVTHTAHFAAVAVGDVPVGIDMEELDRRADLAVARRFFCAAEADWIGEDKERFFRIWTRKEAYLKYLGTGIRRALSSFSVLPGAESEPAAFTEERHQEVLLTICTKEAASCSFSW